MNQTKIQVPKIAQIKAKAALPHKVDPGMNSNASRMPNCAEEMVAPVVGETNLFMHNCCMINPDTLIPTPVQRIASSRGSREIRKISQCSGLPESSPSSRTSTTPMNSDTTESTVRRKPKHRVDRYFVMTNSPFQ